MPPEATLRRLLYPLTGLIVLAWFLFFTWRSVGLYFDSDDMMNLYRAWSQPLGDLVKANVFFWSDSFRPLGAAFYRSIFALAGFNPLPFRIACLGIGIVNMGLCAWFVWLVARSHRTVAYAALLFAFHSRLIEVWYRTAVIYDLLCFEFFFLAACLYVDTRRHGGYPSMARAIAIVLCYIAALNSKEAAVSLPVVLVAYELCFESFRFRHFALPIFLGLLNIPYILGKTTGPNAMTNNSAYRPEYSFERFAHTWALYLNYIFVRPNDSIAPWGAILILAVALGVALMLRSRLLMFAWLLIFAATLPVVFLSYRGGFVLYISYAGWCLYAASLLALPRYPTAIACGVFLIVGWRFGKINLHEQRADPRGWLYDPPLLVHSMADQMRALHPTLPATARILFVRDGFPDDEWTPYFVTKLIYRQDRMLVDLLLKLDRKPSDWTDYDYVFTCESGKYLQLKP